MDLSLRDALGGVGGNRGGLAQGGGGGAGDGVMKMDFMSSLEKESYDDKVGETMSKSDYRPLLDGKDGGKSSGPGMMSSMMSPGGRQDPAGQPAFGSDYLSGPKNLMGGISDPWSQTKDKDSSMTGSHSTPGFVGLDPKTAGGNGGSSPLKTSTGPGLHSMDQFSAAPALSPSGSLEDSSSASSASEPPGPHTTGPEGEVARQQQRRRKKKRKSRDEVYDRLDRQSGQSAGSNGMIGPASAATNTAAMVIPGNERGGREEDDGEEEGEEEEEEESWEWEIRGRGGGGGAAAAGGRGRVRGRKSKSRMRLPEEWGPPQETPSPHQGAGSAPLGPAGVTSPAHESSARPYEPMCVDGFDGRAKASESKDARGPVEASGSLALLSGDNLSPVSQTFSFLDSVLQTPPASAPSSQTTTPVTVLAMTAPPEPTAALPQTSTSVSAGHPPASLASPTSKNAPEASLTALAPSFSPSPLAATVVATPPSAPIGSGLNPDAKPFVPSAAASCAAPSAASSSFSCAPAVSVATPTAVQSAASPPPPPPSVSFPPATAPPPPRSLPAHSEHLDASSPPPPTLPPLEGW
ncbi:hypothetical protein NHX12_004205 [Muraenolepis orangiensis]|uniref:Uncharacterized protein n=1 Tax=Muraenolepis orangiensis TaxID=630683 RepID=A0A9Q0DU01_9TELE|nr:hypothetical protein NHX12_004205 [Muraenolepis orangiensis]